MNRLKKKTFEKLLPFYVIIAIAIWGIAEQLLYGNPTYDDRIIDIFALVLCVAALAFVSIRICMGRGQKQVYVMIANGKLGVNQERANEIINTLLDSADTIHGIRYDKNHILGWNGWYTTLLLRSDIVAVEIMKKTYRYKIFIPVMADYTLKFYLKDRTTQYISVRTMKKAVEICNTLDIIIKE